MDGQKKRGCKEQDLGSTQKKKKVGDALQSIMSADANKLENDEDTDEQKDFQKLEQETSYLTDNTKFFPDLVWNNVMSKIRCTIDIKNCSSSLPYFANFLQEKRYAEIVLPAVFSILSKCYQDKTSDESYKETNLTTIPWNRSQDEQETNPMTNFWKCRLVCKAWNQVIENLYVNESRHFHMKMDENSDEDVNLQNWGMDQFGDDYRAEEFLTKFDPTHFDTLTNQLTKNPFLGRCVQLLYSRNNNENNYHQNFLEILRKYGEEIWYFVLFYFCTPPEDQERDDNRLVELYRKVRHITRLCPNLRVFRIFCDRWVLGEFDSDDENEPEEVDLDIQPILQPNLEELFAVYQEMIRNPLPKFQNLQFLVTNNLPTPIFNELVRQNRADIKQMEIFRKDFHHNYRIFEGGWELPKMEKLSLEFASIADFEQFENCPFILKLKLRDVS